jgi:alpha-glucosidase (family GH31 glycosyl hydrolase)
MGWGERSSEKLFLSDGNYTVFPQSGDYRTEDGSGKTQGAGAHPLLVFQISGTNKWAGLFLFNSAPVSLELNHTGAFVNPTKDWSRIVIRTMGGALDMFIFYGPTFLDVVRQY